ncbi:hypothetical protein BC828DRAFT_375294 [Blastocladiella britannica]|nr:hypothetical protein BC828DRAFT_375294 [Blastocladiella britannica]
MSMDQKQQKDTFEIGIIGMGDMGRLYARSFYQSGWTRINVCDLPEKTASLRAEFPQYNVFENGHLVSRRSDLIIYSVEAKYIASVVAAFGPSTKLNAIVSGQTSVKAPEVAAFEQHLPDDVHIIPVHSMHGPNVSPVGQPLVMVQHRASDAAYAHAQSVYESLGSKVVHLTAKEHDRITADTQAATHLAFKSMGTAWMAQTSFPWEDLNYVGGVDNVKVAMTLRIYSAKWHVYAGLALLNPAARAQIAQYAKSVDGLFSLMIRERADEFRARVHRAVDFVFNGEKAVAERKRRGLLLADALLDEYTLSSGSAASAAAAVAAFTADDAASTKTLPGSPRSAKRNSHLSLLAMVDCWHALTTNPYEHLIVQTPPFRLWLGIVEYLCCTPGLLDAAIDAAIYEKDVRADDLAFVAATNGWAQTILQGHFDSYQARFEHTQAFFSERLEQGRQVSARIIETLGKNMRARGE